MAILCKKRSLGQMDVFFFFIHMKPPFLCASQTKNRLGATDERKPMPSYSSWPEYLQVDRGRKTRLRQCRLFSRRPSTTIFRYLVFKRCQWVSGRGRWMRRLSFFFRKGRLWISTRSKGGAWSQLVNRSPHPCWAPDIYLAFIIRPMEVGRDFIAQEITFFITLMMMNVNNEKFRVTLRSTQIEIASETTDRLIFSLLISFRRDILHRKDDREMDEGHQ